MYLSCVHSVPTTEKKEWLTPSKKGSQDLENRSLDGFQILHKNKKHRALLPKEIIEGGLFLRISTLNLSFTKALKGEKSKF